MFESVALSLVSLLSWGYTQEADMSVPLVEPFLVASSGLDMDELFEGIEIMAPPKFYSRADWGANESLRLKGFFSRLFRNGKSTPPEAKDLPSHMRPELVETELDGEELFWPIERNRVIKKIVVHHTAEAVDEKRSPMTLMRAIYYYHTKTKNWGDIGYNFVIDKRGNVYEGRAGGEDAVGAHTAYFNAGTMGIALMGNFQEERPTERQLRSLEILLAHLALKYDVNLSGEDEFLHSHTHNIAGHRDVAVQGHGTACPGTHLHELLPEIRRDAQTFVTQIKNRRRTTTRDRIAQLSKAQPVVRGHIELEETEKVRQISFSKLLTPDPMMRGESKSIELMVENGTEYTWPRGSTIKVSNVPDGTTFEPFTSVEDIRPGEKGLFRSKITVRTTPNGLYQIALRENLASVSEAPDQTNYPLQISGDLQAMFRPFQTNTFKRSETSLRDIRKPRLVSANKKIIEGKPGMQSDAEKWGHDVKIKIAGFSEAFAHLLSKDWVRISARGQALVDVEPDTIIQLTAREEGLEIEVGDRKWTVLSAEVRTFSQDGILTLKNYDRGLGSIPYNTFRRQLNVHRVKEGELFVVNKLPLEQYLWGLAEEPTSEPLEKKHAIFVLARSYVHVYSGPKRKFRTTLYDLEDDPRTSQFYLGELWERYHHEQKSIVEQTHGMMMTHKGEPVIGPYFTQSAGKSLDIWQSQYPWTQAQDLPYDRGLVQKGHGVGLSGNSARVLAEKGEDYVSILKYFFRDIEVEKIY